MEPNSCPFLPGTASSADLSRMLAFCQREISRLKQEVSQLQAQRDAPFDISERHFQHEVIERRIQLGEDPRHGHPALSTEILRAEGPPDASPEEISLRATYTPVEEDNVLPAFWEPRTYDARYRRLSPAESARLAARISAVAPPASPKRAKAHERRAVTSEKHEESSEKHRDALEKRAEVPEKRSRRPRTAEPEAETAPEAPAKKQRASSQILRLPSLLFDTDSECDATDIELF